MNEGKIFSGVQKHNTEIIRKILAEPKNKKIVLGSGTEIKCKGTTLHGIMGNPYSDEIDLNQSVRLDGKDKEDVIFKYKET